MAGKTLVVEKYDYGFRFFVEGSRTSYFAKHNETKPSAFVLIEEEDRQAVDVMDIPYIVLDVAGLCELYIWVLTQPGEALKELTGEQATIDKVLVEDHSVRFKGGFEDCSFRRIIEPELEPEL